MWYVWNTCIARLCLGLKTTKILKVVDREQVLDREESNRWRWPFRAEVMIGTVDR